MSATTTTFKHVSYLWDEAKAAALAGDEVGLLIYRSNLLGSGFATYQLWRGKYLPQGNGQGTR